MGLINIINENIILPLSDIALGNVIGSNIANIGLVLGITAIISTLDVDKDFYKVNWPMLMLMSFALFYYLQNDGVLTLFEGVILFTALVLFLIFIVKGSRKKTKANLMGDLDDALQNVSNFKILHHLSNPIKRIYIKLDIYQKQFFDIYQIF